MKNELYDDGHEIVYAHELDDYEDDDELWEEYYDEYQKYSSRDRKKKKNLRIKNMNKEIKRER